MDKALNYIGLARRGGYIEIGEQRAKALVKAGKARLMLVASDTSDGAKRRAEGYVYGYPTPLVSIPYTKEELSRASGTAGCSMAAFADAGLALSFLRALETERGEAHTEAAQALQQQLDRSRKSGNRRKSE